MRKLYRHLPTGLLLAALASTAPLLACSGGSGGAKAADALAISPSKASAAVGGSVQFAASAVTAADSVVTWSVEESSGGSIDTAGLYTAPSTAGTFHVVATSASDSSKTARATVVVGGSADDQAGDGLSSEGTGTTYSPSYVSVTGGGAFPSLTGAPAASCAGDGATDDTSCLQAAITAAAKAGKPLTIPATSAYYKITSPLTVTTSLIGTGGMPTIKQASTCSTSSCAGLRLAQGMTGWIYNLHVVGAYSGTRGEFAHNISVGGVDGVTIKGNLLEDAIGDGVADNAQEDDSAAAQNVLIDGNTVIHSARCMISIVNVSDRWAIMNNDLQDTAPWVSPIDLEPWQEASYVSNVEVGYNKLTTVANATETAAGNFLGGVAANAWYDSTPGKNIYAHHNYGSWPFSSFLANITHAGTFSNVVAQDNVEGSSVP